MMSLSSRGPAAALTYPYLEEIVEASDGHPSDGPGGVARDYGAHVAQDELEDWRRSGTWTAFVGRSRLDVPGLHR